MFPASLIKHFLDLLLMDPAHSSSALIMNRVVAFCCCLLDHLSSDLVVRMVTVTVASFHINIGYPVHNLTGLLWV